MQCGGLPRLIPKGVTDYAHATLVQPLQMLAPFSVLPQMRMALLIV